MNLYEEHFNKKVRLQEYFDFDLPNFEKGFPVNKFKQFFAKVEREEYSMNFPFSIEQLD